MGGTPRRGPVLDTGLYRDLLTRDQPAGVNVWAAELVQGCCDRRARLAVEPLSTVRHLPLWRAAKGYCPLVPPSKLPWPPVPPRRERKDGLSVVTLV